MVFAAVLRLLVVFFAAVFRAVVFFAGVLLRAVVRAMAVLRPAGVRGAVLVVEGDEGCEGGEDRGGDEVGPGHTRLRLARSAANAGTSQVL
ncbi:hypothetical protein GCM10018777_56920 [Streptomyces albogriseolus]|nr:hypothetical protein GCM10010330_80970 [Streptomyces tendae]GHG33340.1 hypothetical protein GCM10018777_56920 [Streptomyces viridodiastaticus]